MLRKMNAPTLALALMLAIAQPVAAAPLGLHGIGWVEILFSGIVEALEEALLPSALSSDRADKAVASSSNSGENTSAALPEDEQEEPTPAFWPGYDPVG